MNTQQDCTCGGQVTDILQRMKTGKNLCNDRLHYVRAGMIVCRQTVCITANECWPPGFYYLSQYLCADKSLRSEWHDQGVCVSDQKGWSASASRAAG